MRRFTLVLLTNSQSTKTRGHLSYLVVVVTERHESAAYSAVAARSRNGKKISQNMGRPAFWDTVTEAQGSHLNPTHPIMSHI